MRLNAWNDDEVILFRNSFEMIQRRDFFWIESGKQVLIVSSSSWELVWMCSSNIAALNNAISCWFRFHLNYIITKVIARDNTNFAASSFLRHSSSDCLRWNIIFPCFTWCWNALWNLILWCDALLLSYKLSFFPSLLRLRRRVNKQLFKWLFSVFRLLMVHVVHNKSSRELACDSFTSLKHLNVVLVGMVWICCHLKNPLDVRGNNDVGPNRSSQLQYK